MDDGCTQKSLFDLKSELTPPRKAYCAFLAGQGASFLLGHNVRLVNSQKAGLEAAPHTAC